MELMAGSGGFCRDGLARLWKIPQMTPSRWSLAGVIIAAVTPGTVLSRLLSWQPLVVVGLWSYSLYLWHYPVARLTRVEFDGVTSTLITLAVSLVLAALTYRFIELRFYRPRRSALPVAA
jgi:peptidoglycan/LPS O-acetylase OafA/YrhL